MAQTMAQNPAHPNVLLVPCLVPPSRNPAETRKRYLAALLFPPKHPNRA